MDNLDKSIIKILEEDSRISISDISKKINLSRCSVKDRINRLKENKLIEKFSIRTSYQKKGYKVIFVIIIKEVYDINTNICDFLKTNPFVINVYHTTGVCNYILKVATPDIKTMHSFIFDLQQLARIETSIILDKIFEKDLELRLTNI